MLYLSPSTISAFFRCARRAELLNRWKPEMEPAEPFSSGVRLHKVFETGEVPPDFEFKEALDRVRRAEAELLDQIVHREHKISGIVRMRSMFDPNRTIECVFSRVFDAIGLDFDGNPVVLDYKTTFRSLNSFPSEMVFGFQASAYLLPWGMGDLAPAKVHFIAVNPRSADIRVFSRARDPIWEENFLRAFRMVASHLDLGEPLPMNPGYECSFCDVYPLCWLGEDDPDHTSGYRKRADEGRVISFEVEI
jgi:hypothetical protein